MNQSHDVTQSERKLHDVKTKVDRLFESCIICGTLHVLYWSVRHALSFIHDKNSNSLTAICNISNYPSLLTNLTMNIKTRI